MPTTKNNRRGYEEKNRKGRLAEKASSFHGRIAEAMVVENLHRPRTVPDLLSRRNVTGVSTAEIKPKLTKLLLNVTIQRSLGPIMVIMSLESTVDDLIAAALRQYAKEGRRPILGAADCSRFDLHYSQFSLESLDREEKLMNLGSRNFFLCPKKSDTTESGGGTAIPPTPCSKQAEKGPKLGWLKFMDFLVPNQSQWVACLLAF